MKLQNFKKDNNLDYFPGSAFGADEYLRLSYATSRENTSKGLQRIEGLINKILIEGGGSYGKKQNLYY